MNATPAMQNVHRQTRQTIVRLLSGMGSAKEISQYLKRFSQLDAARFAVVKVGGAVLRDDLDALVSSLAFLQQVGLTPIVLHGAGPQLDEAMRDAGIDKRVVDNLRYTDAEGLAIVRRVMREENLRWWRRCRPRACVPRRQSGVFECAFLDAERYGLVGQGGARRTPMAWRRPSKAVSIPVIASLGETAPRPIVNVKPTGPRMN